MRTKFVYAALAIMFVPLPAFGTSLFSAPAFSGFSPTNFTPPALAGSFVPAASFGQSFDAARFTLGPASFSVPLFEARSHDRVLSLVLREARAVMKDCCNQASRGLTAVVNGRARQLRYTFRVESFDSSVMRDNSVFVGTANVGFSCVLR